MSDFILGGVDKSMPGLFSKLSLWSFIAMKQLLSPLICNLFTTSLSFKVCLSSLLILYSIFSVTFLYLDVTALCKNLLCSSFVRQFKLAVLFANSSVFLELHRTFDIKEFYPSMKEPL